MLKLTLHELQDVLLLDKLNSLFISVIFSIIENKLIIHDHQKKQLQILT